MRLLVCISLALVVYVNCVEQRPPVADLPSAVKAAKHNPNEKILAVKPNMFQFQGIPAVDHLAAQRPHSLRRFQKKRHAHGPAKKRSMGFIQRRQTGYGEPAPAPAYEEPTTTTPEPTTETVIEYETPEPPPKYDDTFVGQYYYGIRGQKNATFPLPSCFVNPSGYVCCNLALNDLMIDTYEQAKKEPKFNRCNILKVAHKLQKSAQEMFQLDFEIVVGYEDYSQKIHFRKDLVCKIETDDRYLVAYATAQSVVQEKIIPPVAAHSAAH